MGQEEDLYLPVDKFKNAPTVEEQIADDNSLLHMVKKLVALRKSSDALGSDGEVEFLNRENRGYPLVYTRTDGEDTYLICINPTGQAQTFDLKESEQYHAVLQNKEITLEQGKIILPEVSFWIAKKKE